MSPWAKWFHKKLKESGQTTKLIYYGENDLGHAFVAIYPWLEKSRDAMEKMMAWFEERAKDKRSAR